MEEFVLSAATGKSYQLTFGNIVQSSEFTAMYDSYRISKWVVRLYYSASENPTDSTYVNTAMVGWAFDSNDATTPVDMNQLREYSSFKERPLVRCQPWARITAPKCNLNVYNGAGNAFMVPRRNPWLNTDVTNVPHYAVKLWFEAPAVTTMKVRLVGTVYFACKNVK